MSTDLNESEIIQNPALGAFLLWKFGLGFQADDSLQGAVPLFFLVLPLLLHSQTGVVIDSTRKTSGLALFAAKLGEDRENLLAVHERALALRNLTWDSIELGIRSGLLTVDYSAANLRANTLIGASAKPTLPERLKSMPAQAEKLGYWFSKSGINQIASVLKVEF
jgi:hypothetical protein